MKELYENKIKKYKSAFLDPTTGGKITDFIMYRELEKDLAKIKDRTEEQELEL